jgi:hypothetical protein
LAPETTKYEQLEVAQLIDLNPGTRAGLFWTVPVTDDSVTVDPVKGIATLDLQHVGVHDYTDLASALLSNETGYPSVASMSVQWTIARNPNGSFQTDTPVNDAENLLRAAHNVASATIVFSGWHVPDTARAGQSTFLPLAFRSGLASPTDTTGQVTPAFGSPSDPLSAGGQPWAVVGRERNGVYY